MSLHTYDIALEGERIVVTRLVPAAKACLGVAVFILATLLVTLIVLDPHVLAVVAALVGIGALVAAGLALRERTEVSRDAFEPQVVETVRRAAPDLIEFLARNALRAEAGDERAASVIDDIASIAAHRPGDDFTGFEPKAAS